MQVNSITDNTFAGKIKFDKKFPKKKLQMVNEVLDYKINNVSTRERIKKATEDLSNVAQPIFAKLYQNGGNGGNDGGAGGGAGDTEFHQG